jgi:hypothetical protein
MFLAIFTATVVALIAFERWSRPGRPRRPGDDSWHTRTPS